MRLLRRRAPADARAAPPSAGLRLRFPSLSFPGSQAVAQAMSGLMGRRLALSVQGTSLRLVLAERRRVVQWVQIPFNPAFLRGGFIGDRQGMSALIRNVLTSRGIARAPLVAAFPGFQSVVRIIRLPRSRDIHPREVVPREARRLMAFSEQEQHLFWGPIASDGPVQRFLVVTVPKAPLQAHLETLRDAGVFPRRVTLAPLGLLNGLGSGEAVVVNVEHDSLDIAIVVDSLPFLVRSLWLGDEPLTMDTMAARLAEELGTSIDFFNQANPDAHLSAALPVQLAGGFFTEELAPEVAQATGRPVVPLIPPVTAPPEFPTAAMATVAGLVLEK